MTKLKTIEVPEVGRIEYYEHKVNFPEKIVEDTGGVQGYVRKTILWEELSKKLLQINSHGTKKLLKTYDKIEEIKTKRGKIKRKIHDIITEEENRDELYTSANKIENLETDLYETYKKANLRDENTMKTIETLTDDNFIKKTFNHRFSWTSAVNRDKTMKYLVKDKLLLQKIFDQTKQKEYGKKCGDGGCVPYPRIKYTFNNQNQLIDLTGNPEEESYSILPTALSTSPRGYVWELDHKNDVNIALNIVFGFGNKNKAFHHYLTKIKKLYDEILPQIRKKEIMACEGISHNEILTNRDISNYKDYINEYLGGVGVHYEIGSNSEYHHPIIPIISNHPDIPELRWCHADYASIPTKKGLNLIEMVSE